MDGGRFDDLTRAVAAARSRRRLLAALAGSALVAAGFGPASAAVRKRAVGNARKVNGDCASGLCAAESPTRKTCHCRSAADCPAPSNHCLAASCAASGACGVIEAVVCTAFDRCHVAGVCDPATGVCSNPAAHDGAICDDHDACTINDACQAGVCAGTPAPVDCVVSGWSDWSACSRLCGAGTQTRTRTIVTPASCGGIACPTLTDSQSCSGACLACTTTQEAGRNPCNNWNLISGDAICAYGGTFPNVCCAADADCPSDAPYCVVSLQVGSFAQQTTCHQDDPTKGQCGLPAACPIAP